MKDLPTKTVAIISTVILLIVLVLSFTFLNPPQCAEKYTQVQIDKSDCIVGANIGLGLLNLFVIVPWAIYTVFVWVRYIIDRKKPAEKKTTEKKTPKKKKHDS